MEIEHFLTRSGFALRRLGVFPELDEDPSEAMWNTMIVAEAVGQQPDDRVCITSSPRR